MNTVLKKFVNEPLFEACAAMLNHLHIEFNEVTRTPVPFEGLYRNPLTKALQEILSKVDHTYFIGTVDEASLSGHSAHQDGNDVTRKASEGKYVGMMMFAVDIKDEKTLTRTEIATLTRGFNRIAAAQPVVLFIKQDDHLALATCERSDYTQQWRDGEKLGKVCMLRNINCQNPHRGHIDILESIGDKAYPTFEELYKHWMQVFSSELLTKKFYSELSDWYAWAVQVARFPNDLATTADDEKFNHESCIRLITRLIFVWFLKQKHLIPKEFFDERYIHEHFIENFNPHDRENLLYNPENSKYYRLILQNLFFAMLNRPIVPEGKDTPNNRRFRVKGNFHGMNPDYAVNNLLRYEGEFKEGGAEEFLAMANSNVPFLNGGLFDCLDDKPKNLYYDGFSERLESLEQLYLPDWLFFGEEVGRSIDLSKWYDDPKKKNVSARGIIDILKKYNFTIEENTPLDQEVSLDPELLGKAFENLLASYNEETHSSARKQTGSFYTPREIVQYMVDESLVAHLKRICGDELEPQYRSLLSYATEETTLNKEQRRSIMQAIYNCRVLDPACGSGAFPMGMLQQMVHILRQLDPTNEMWKDFMIDIAIDQSRKAFNAEEEEERKARRADIEEAFNRHVNDPDYARKLYLIEHCIYGVDIQPIAVQISKLRFFISLVVDQNPTDDAAHNFGIRPLPNLESKFVAANTLIPVEYDASLFESTDAILSLKDELKELNHAIFLAKRNIDKQRLKTKIKETRKALAQAIEYTGFVNPGAAQKLADWDMFEQNTHAEYFDAEWMFGVKGGFDIVIANPPYKILTKNNTNQNLLSFYIDRYESLKKASSKNIFTLFVEIAILKLTGKEGPIITYIVPEGLFQTRSYKECVDVMYKYGGVSQTVTFTDYVFENAITGNIIFLYEKGKSNSGQKKYVYKGKGCFEAETKEDNPLIDKIQIGTKKLSDVANLFKGMVIKDRDTVLRTNDEGQQNRFILGKNISKWSIDSYFYTDYSELRIVGGTKKIEKHNTYPRIVIRRTGDELCCAMLNCQCLTESTLYSCWPKESHFNIDYLYGLLNSKLLNYYNYHKNVTNQQGFPQILLTDLQSLPIIIGNKKQIECIANHARNKNQEEIDRLVYHLYGLNYDEVLIVDPTPSFSRQEFEQDSFI